jgi:hypothetical protein
MKILINGYTVTESMKLKMRNKDELIKEMNRLDKVIGHIKRNKKLYMKLVMVVAIMFLSGYISPAHAMIDVETANEKINLIGRELWKLIQTLGYWTTLLITAKKCLTDAISGNSQAVGNTVMKGVMIMAIMYYLPELFDLMKSIVVE